MKKDIKLSNIKGLLIFLVVFGHLLAPYQEKFNGLYLFIYSFHMPLFVLISGFFSKRASLKKAANFVLLYLLFQLLYQSFLVLIKPGHTFELKYQDPYYHLWYLVSMSLWYVIAIGINKLKLNNMHKISLVMISFAIGIVSKFFTPYVVAWMQTYDHKLDSYTFSYQRTLSFLPFFVLGLFLTKENMSRLYHSLKGKWLIPIMTALGIFTYYTFCNDINTENILKGSYGIDQMEGPLRTMTIQIILAYILAIVMCYMILNFIGNKRCFLTKWGDSSLVIFLFHIFYTRTIKTFTGLGELSTWILLPLLFVMAVAIVVMLSSDAFSYATYYLWHPYELLELAFRKNKTQIGASEQ